MTKHKEGRIGGIRTYHMPTPEDSVLEELYNRAREVDPESRELEEIQARWYAHPKIRAMLDKMEAWNWGLVELLGISETTFGSELSLKGDPKKKWHVQIVDSVIKKNGSNKARFCINYSNPDAFKYENFVPDITVTDNNRRNETGGVQELHYYMQMKKIGCINVVSNYWVREAFSGKWKWVLNQFQKYNNF